MRYLSFLFFFLLSSCVVVNAQERVSNARTVSGERNILQNRILL